MDWLILAFIAPLLWAISNFIDKFLVEKHFKGGIGTLVMYSCFIGLPVAILVAIFNPNVFNINPATAIFIIANGFVYIGYLFPYLKALNKADTSVVVPLFQIIPVFDYLLALLILGEVLSNMQIIGSLMIIGGAVGISIKFKGKKTRLRGDVIRLMLFACLLIAINSVMFKFFAIDTDFWTVTFWENVGLAVFGLILLISVRRYRNDFISSFKKNGKKIIALNAFNEIISIIGIIIFTYAFMFAPLALVSVINGFQPLFVFLIGATLTIFFPSLIKEELNKKIILQKVIFIGLMIWGAYLLGVNY